MRILVTGGAGYIGSVVTEELVKDGHDVVVYDSLYKGHRGAVVSGAKFVHADLVDTQTLHKTFNDNRIEAVIHMAADSLVGESVSNPGKYYRSNVIIGLTLLDAMRASDIRRIVFSSTAATYGEPEKQPIQPTQLILTEKPS
jgi:UDP-glucose 4-epimerase